ncbi:hypothetical protein TVAG_084490 [Trichomonas vaginalis G3]|uniref:Uncharacterized protein n=1 Tax=Trichomonas vaginalis (strain ATCC PRA-98 / G3) TaxID=412133 RepID=A2G0V2_TRIV3|nr:hypothetical protein TVAGG3_0293900 [Trichomonas vaginalis G3]EAX89218.1 hypothetical protein TVAG_084490 [Trichomonas vaginalis G3]KAI5527474.1 hypothetical protein TVAGG3_0293900 [Trichomonas vaginalis G3]|eukprot:XP_001302148.1 hypothetical protein [Trichomonas vaginalis G3]
MASTNYAKQKPYYCVESLPTRSKLAPYKLLYDNNLYIIEDILFQADDIQLPSKYINLEGFEDMGQVLNYTKGFTCNLNNNNYKNLEFKPAFLIINHKGIIESLSYTAYLDGQ